MLRLLDDGDVRFVSSRKPHSLTRLRRARCRILRRYLRCLTSDFSRVLTALKLVMTQASNDRPDLAALIIRSQATFAACMVLVRVQLVLYSVGIGTVNISELLKVFEGMRLELRMLLPAASDSPA